MAGSDYLKSNMRPALVVLAGGVGKRYGGYKQLKEVGPSGETILEYSVYDAIQAGFGKVVFIVGGAIEEEIRSRLTSKLEERIEVRFVRQELNTLPSGFTLDSSRTKPWGTGQRRVGGAAGSGGSFCRNKCGRLLWPERIFDSGRKSQPVDREFNSSLEPPGL